MKFLREVFSENGVGSYSRVAAGFIVMATCAWITYALFKNHGALPDFQGPSYFLGTGVGIHYGSNKLPDILAAFKGKQQG